MRIAVISDIHGNVAALEAVLSDIRRRHADRLVNLGDIVSGPLWPRETLQLLEQVGIISSVSGNHDRTVAHLEKAQNVGASDRYAWSSLNDIERKTLECLSSNLWAAPGVFACHGTPTSDTRYLLEDVSDGRLVLAQPATIQNRLNGCDARIILCGHSHQQRVVQIASEQLIINPGSVGNPAFRSGDGSHISEAGSPQARYAIVEVRKACAIELFSLDYDWSSAARRAAANDRMDWAQALTTGFVCSATA